MSWSRRLLDQANAYYQFYADKTVLAMKPVSQAIAILHQSEPVTHFTKGFTQLFRVPHFLRNGLQTSNVVLQSLNTNVLQYIMPIILYRRGINIMLDESPEWLSPIIHTMDWALTITYLTRLYLRRTVDNTVYPISLLRSIANDVEDYLPALMADELAQALSDMFTQIFLNATKSEVDFYNNLNLRFYSILKGFFKLPAVEAETLNKLKRPFAEAIIETINQQELINIADDDLLHDFSNIVTRLMIATFARAFKPASSGTLEKHKSALKKILEKNFTKDRADFLCRELSEKIYNALLLCKPFLPINPVESCSCTNPKKIIHGALSSSFYATGNLIFCSLPDLLNKIVVIRPGALIFSRAFFMYIRFLIYGQILNDYKVWGCTRHRYKIFSKNKLNSLGVASAIFLLMAIINACVETFSTQCYQDNYFKPNAFEKFLISDGILNITLLNGIISTLAFKEPLQGTKESALDIFSFFRNKIRQCLSMISRDDSGITLYSDIKSLLSSPYFNTLGDWLLQGYAPYPKEFFHLVHQKILRWLDKQAVSLPHDETLSDPHPFKSDAIAVLFKTKSVNACLQLYEKDIIARLSDVENWHHRSKWFGKPVFALLSLPVPGLIRSLLTLPLLCLNDESLPLVIEKLRTELIKIAQEKNIIMVDISPPTSPTDDPIEQAASSKAILSQSEHKEGKIVMVLDEPEDDIEFKDKEDDYLLVDNHFSYHDQNTTPQSNSVTQSLRYILWQQDRRNKASRQSAGTKLPDIALKSIR